MIHMTILHAIALSEGNYMSAIISSIGFTRQVTFGFFCLEDTYGW